MMEIWVVFLSKNTPSVAGNMFGGCLLDINFWEDPNHPQSFHDSKWTAGETN